jgi:hypothetical protein
MWIVSRRFDLAVFLGPATVALLLVPLGSILAPGGELPLPMWILAVMMVDVAHVWSTIFRTYLDTDELRRHRARYTLVPLLAYLLGAALHLISAAAFWTALAYLAVWHFVRQQYGWVAMYERRDPRIERADLTVDALAIYAATLFPILWWHAHLPRRFDWFVEGDYLGDLVPEWLSHLATLPYVAALAIFLVRQVEVRLRDGRWRTGKIVLVATTALCWGVGIIATDSDWSFTVTNVLIHGVPYMALVWIYGRRKSHRRGSLLARVFEAKGPALFLGSLAIIAFVEELGWDRLVFHDRPELFRLPEIALGDRWLSLVVPLLALPQAVHYLLDGFIWRREERAILDADHLPTAIPTSSQHAR